MLAWFWLTRRSGGLVLHPVPLDRIPASLWLPDSVDVFARSAWLRSLSQTLITRSSELRAMSARLPRRRGRSWAMNL